MENNTINQTNYPSPKKLKKAFIWDLVESRGFFNSDTWFYRGMEIVSVRDHKACGGIPGYVELLLRNKDIGDTEVIHVFNDVRVANDISIHKAGQGYK